MNLHRIEDWFIRILEAVDAWLDDILSHHRPPKPKRKHFDAVDFKIS